VQEPPTLLHFLLGGLAVAVFSVRFGHWNGNDENRVPRPEELKITSASRDRLYSFLSSAMSGIGMVQSRALLAGPVMPIGAVGDAHPTLGFQSVAPDLLQQEGVSEFRWRPTAEIPFESRSGTASLMVEADTSAATRLILMTTETKMW